MKYNVMWLNEEDCDPNIFGGGVAYTTSDKDEAIEVAKRCTANGHPCFVEYYVEGLYETVWHPEEDEA